MHRTANWCISGCWFILAKTENQRLLKLGSLTLFCDMLEPMGKGQDQSNGFPENQTGQESKLILQVFQNQTSQGLNRFYYFLRSKLVKGQKWFFEIGTQNETRPTLWFLRTISQGSKPV